MVTRLFSAFEPSYSITRVVFITSLIIIFIFPKTCIFRLSHSHLYFINTIQNKIKRELEAIINPDNKNFTNVLIGLIVMLLCINLVGIIPYTFTRTTHISFTFSLAIRV